jgi:hypothetical protein
MSVSADSIGSPALRPVRRSAEFSVGLMSAYGAVDSRDRCGRVAQLKEVAETECVTRAFFTRINSGPSGMLEVSTVEHLLAPLEQGAFRPD